MNDHPRAAHLRGAGPLAAGLQSRIDDPSRSVVEQRCANHGPRPARSTLRPLLGRAERSRPMFLRRNSAMRNSGCDVHGAPHSGSGERQDAPQSGAGLPPQDAREGLAGQHPTRGGRGSPPGPLLSKTSFPGVACCTGEEQTYGFRVDRFAVYEPGYEPGYGTSLPYRSTGRSENPGAVESSCTRSAAARPGHEIPVMRGGRKCSTAWRSRPAICTLLTGHTRYKPVAAQPEISGRAGR